MKIAFITTAVYPSPTANRIHILSMVKAFAKKGVLVSLLCQKVSGVDLPVPVEKKEIGTTRSVSSAWRYSAFLKKTQHDVWFIREPHLMLLTIFFFVLRSRRLPPFILYEVHDLPRDIFDAISLKILTSLKAYKIIVITHLLKDDLINSYKIPSEKIVVLPDGVDVDMFSDEQGKDFSCKGEDIPVPLVLYTGSLFPWKGVYTLVETARLLPHIHFWFVGGYEDDIAMLKSASADVHNVKIWGYVPHVDVKGFLQKADVLVLPNSATYRMSERYTSPLKLFEYMASCKPIVASSLPSIKEILKDGKNAYLVEADDPRALKEGIEKALSDEKRDMVVLSAKRDVANYTWDARVEKILNFLN